MTDHKIPEGERHHNKCLEFQVADDTTVDEVLDNHEDEKGNNGSGPWVGQYSGDHNDKTLLVEGYPFTGFKTLRDGRIKVFGDRGSVTFDAEEISHASGMHGVS